jgi:hypothetical protein
MNPTNKREAGVNSCAREGFASFSSTGGARHATRISTIVIHWLYENKDITSITVSTAH